MDITIRNLKKSFGLVQALKPTNLVIKPRHFTTLLGPSGCGKTTLLRLIAGLETPDQGELYVGDECIFSCTKQFYKPAHQRNFGMVFQDFALWPHMTVFENIAFGLRATGRIQNLNHLVYEAIEMIRLTGLEKRYPHELSGGQQQRVAFARAVIIKPQLILFDEPLSALDAVLRNEMRIELLNLVNNFGLTVLYVTHDQTEALSMSDEIVVMKDGQILQAGSPEAIYETPSHPFVASFIGKANWLVQNQTLFRPEHICWERDDRFHTFQGIIQSVNYIGDRYEIQLDMGDRRIWTGYHKTRLSIGNKVNLYVSPQNFYHICQAEGSASWK
jgi:iron(III) transport system ATP-binding protein